MPNRSTWITLGALLAFSIALICCTALGIQVLHGDKYVTAGIATLTFNFSDIHLLNNPLIIPRAIPGSDIIQSLGAQSATNVIASAIRSVGIAATAIPDANEVKEMIPRNCSLGTKQFCVGFDNRLECNNLPLNLSIIATEAVVSFVGNQFQTVQPLQGILAKVTVANIQNCLISGLVLMLVITTIFISSLFGLANCLLRLGIRIWMLTIFIVGLICCVPFGIPTVILFTAQSIQNLSSAIEVQKGDASNYCLGALCCGFIMVLLATISPIF